MKALFFCLAVLVLCACQNKEPAPSSSSTQTQSIPSLIAELLNSNLATTCKAVQAQELRISQIHIQAESYWVVQYPAPHCAGQEVQSEAFGLFRQNSLGKIELLDERFENKILSLEANQQNLVIQSLRTVNGTTATTRQVYQIQNQRFNEVTILKTKLDTPVKTAKEHPAIAKTVKQTQKTTEYHIKRPAPPAPKQVLRKD